ncbi:MAG: acetyltransferase, family, partial [Paenibacillaceae bacterium]|nr:acetyltransferase, family [Paenibacillaceae bacterium]
MDKTEVEYRAVENFSGKNKLPEFRNGIVVSRGKIHQIDQLPGFVAVSGGSVVGLLTYHIDGSDCEIVSLDSKAENQGIGSTLIQLARDATWRNGCTRLWLITSNDNIRAIRFYQKRGFDMKCIHRNAIEEARKIKPSIPRVGVDGIPV